MLSVSTRHVGQVDDKLVRSDLDPSDVIAEESCIFAACVRAKMLPNRGCDEGLDVVRRQAADGSGLCPLTLHEGCGDIVPILDAVLSRVARAHAIAAIVEDAADQQGLGLHPDGFVIGPLLARAWPARRRTAPDPEWQAARPEGSRP